MKFLCLILCFLSLPGVAFSSEESKLERQERLTRLRTYLSTFFATYDNEKVLQAAKNMPAAEAPLYLKKNLPHFTKKFEGTELSLLAFIEKELKDNFLTRASLPILMEPLARQGDLKEVALLIHFPGAKKLFPNRLINSETAFEYSTLGPHGLNAGPPILGSFTRMFQVWLVESDIAQVIEEIVRLNQELKQVGDFRQEKQMAALTAMVSILRPHFTQGKVAQLIANQMKESAQFRSQVMTALLNSPQDELKVSPLILQELMSAQAFTGPGYFYGPAEEVVKALTHLYQKYAEDEALKKLAPKVLANLANYQILDPRMGPFYDLHFPLVELLCRPGYQETLPQECPHLISKLQEHRTPDMRPHLQKQLQDLGLLEEENQMNDEGRRKNSAPSRLGEAIERSISQEAQ